jgi:hypothetical protein
MKALKKDSLEYLEKNLDLKELVPEGFMPEVLINSYYSLDKRASKIIKLIPEIKATEDDETRIRMRWTLIHYEYLFFIHKSITNSILGGVSVESLQGFVARIEDYGKRFKKFHKELKILKKREKEYK